MSDVSTDMTFGPVFEDEAQLAQLIAWCREHASSEVAYLGSQEEQYRRYYVFAETYDQFLEDLPTDLSTTRPEWNGLNAIQYAAEQGYDRFIEETDSISAVALNTPNAVGMTPLHVCAAKGYLATLQALLDKGAVISCFNERQQTPAHMALLIPVIYFEGYVERKKQIFKTLIAREPALLTQKDESGDTVFHLMAIDGFEDLLMSCLDDYEGGAFQCDNLGHYPIHKAILNGFYATASHLLTWKPQVSTLADEKRRVAIHYAARYAKDTSFMRLCCEVTPDGVSLRDGEGKTPCMLAAEAENTIVQPVLLEFGAAPAECHLSSSKPTA